MEIYATEIKALMDQGGITQKEVYTHKLWGKCNTYFNKRINKKEKQNKKGVFTFSEYDYKRIKKIIEDIQRELSPLENIKRIQRESFELSNAIRKVYRHRGFSESEIIKLMDYDNR